MHSHIVRVRLAFKSGSIIEALAQNFRTITEDSHHISSIAVWALDQDISA